MNIKTLASSSAGNCHVVDDGATRIMLDAGIPWREIQQKMDFRTYEVSGVMLSHEHGDHSKAVSDAARAGIDIYSSHGTLFALGLSGHRIHEVEPDRQFTVGTWIVRPFEVEHDAAEPLGFLLYSTRTKEKLLYLTDTAYCRYLFKGVTHFMIEINYDTATLYENVVNGSISIEIKNRLLKSHFSLENAINFLKANDLSKTKEIIILHVSEHNANYDLIKRSIQRTTGKLVTFA